MANGQQLLAPLYSQPDGIPSQLPHHGNQAQGYCFLMMAQSFLRGDFSSQGRSNLLRSFPQEKASHFLGVVVTRFEGPTEASMENEAIRGFLNELLYDLSRQGHAPVWIYIHPDRDITGLVSPKSGTHP